MSPVKKIRILLACRPLIMQEVVRRLIERQEDMEVVGDFLEPIHLLVAVRERKADAVIIALEDYEEPALCSHLLAEYPNLTILGLAPDSKTALIRPRRREIVEPSQESALDALRQATMREFLFGNVNNQGFAHSHLKRREVTTIMPRLKYIMPGIQPYPAGDGKAAMCCVSPEALEAIKTRTDRGDDLITATIGLDKSKILEETMKTKPILEAIGIGGVEPSPAGDGKALMCC